MQEEFERQFQNLKKTETNLSTFAACFNVNPNIQLELNELQCKSQLISF
jgi:hypothetical protein